MQRLALALAVLAAPAAAQNYDMIGISWGGNVYEVDSTSGATQLIGSSGFSSTNSMAKDPATGTLYAFSAGTLVTIDPTTGVGTAGASVSLTDVRGMTFDDAGTLWVVDVAAADTLYTVDPATGTKTLVGPTGASTIQALGHANGTLYAYDCASPGLITLDKTTGQFTDVNPSAGGSCSDLQALCTDSGGQLYGARDALWIVNAATGLYSQIGPTTSHDLRGIEFKGASGMNGTPEQLSVSTGGSQVLSMNVGAGQALKNYFVLGSLSGTVPGIPYAGWVVPLNFDPYLLYTANNPNTPLLSGSAGILNSTGSATIVFTLPPASDPALAGLTVHHVGVVFDPQPGFLGLSAVTNPAPCLFTP